MSRLCERQRYEKLHELWQVERFRNLNPFYLTRRRMIRKIVFRRLMTGVHILDVGCGIGDTMFMLRPLSKVSVGLDLSLGALKEAATKLKEGHFLLADATAIPLRSDFFHLAICTEVLEHLEEDAEAVAEIARVLGGGGQALFTTPQNPKYWTPEDSFDGHLRRYQVSEFVEMVERHLRVKILLTFGFPLAFLFRKYISSRLFDMGLYKPLTRGKAFVTRAIASFLAQVFRFDDLFSSTNLGLTLIAVAEKILLHKWGQTNHLGRTEKPE